MEHQPLNKVTLQFGGHEKGCESGDAQHTKGRWRCHSVSEAKLHSLLEMECWTTSMPWTTISKSLAVRQTSGCHLHLKIHMGPLNSTTSWLPRAWHLSLSYVAAMIRLLSLLCVPHFKHEFKGHSVQHGDNLCVRGSLQGCAAEPATNAQKRGDV